MAVIWWESWVTQLWTHCLDKSLRQWSSHYILSRWLDKLFRVINSFPSVLFSFDIYTFLCQNLAVSYLYFYTPKSGHKVNSPAPAYMCLCINVYMHYHVHPHFCLAYNCPVWLMLKLFDQVVPKNKILYSRHSLSRSLRDSLKYFEIPVSRHIRFTELRKK